KGCWSPAPLFAAHLHRKLTSTVPSPRSARLRSEQPMCPKPKRPVPPRVKQGQPRQRPVRFPVKPVWATQLASPVPELRHKQKYHPPCTTRSSGLPNEHYPHH